MGFKISTLVKYWHLVGMSRWESWDTQVIIWGQYHFPSILILEQFCLDMEGLAWYINPNGIKNKNTVKYPYHVGIKKLQNPHYRWPNDLKQKEKDNTKSNKRFQHMRLHQSFCHWVTELILRFSLCLKWKDVMWKQGWKHEDMVTGRNIWAVRIPCTRKSCNSGIL